MPFKSEAQRRKFGSLVAQGKMSQETFNKWNEHTPKGPLPERVHKKDVSKPRSIDDIKSIYKKRFGV